MQLTRKIAFVLFLFLGIFGVVSLANAQLTGGTGGVGLPQASGSGQCVISTSAGVNYIAGTCGSGNLPSLGSGGTVLFQNAAGTAATWATCAGDATCSAVTPGSFTINAIRGHTVKNVLPTDAQLLIWNNTNSDWEPISISGDLTITNAGVTTVASTHITGAVNNQLTTFTGTGNLANYAGTTACASQVMTSLSAAGVASCNTINSNYVNTSIGTTGGDINTAVPSLVVQTHIPGAVTGGLPRYGSGGTLGNATAGSDYAPATQGTAVLKGNGSGGFTNAIAKQDYAPATTGTAILKGDNLGGFNSAVAKTDYVPATTGTVNTPLFNDGLGGTTNGTVSGSTTEMTTFAGAAIAGRCLRLDNSGNASIAAGDCSTGVGFINTPTVTTGAATVIAQCTSSGCTDYDRIANGANTGTLTLTTPASTSMNDGEEVSVEVDMDGTHVPSSVAWIAGTGVTLAYGNLGAASTATACAIAAATGYNIYNWLWNATSGKLTLHDCSPVPAATTLSVALGGTAASTAAGARSSLAVAASGTNGDITSLTGLTTALPVNEGGTAATTAAAALTSLGAPPSGVDVSSAGQVTNSHFASALPVPQGGTGQTTLTSGAPLFGTGTSGITQGTLSGTGTELATFTGPATTSRCIHTNASGNLTIAAGDCTTGTAATPGFINSPTVTTGATNLGTSCSGGTCMQCAAAGCTDYERVANGANTAALTITTATLAQMTDGETLDVEVDTDGTHAPSSVAWTAGTNVALKYANLGAGTTATACPPPSATGMELYSWQWNGSTTPGNLTLEYCSPVPAATNLSIALGGTNCSATTIATLPVTPQSGTTCYGITNAASCTAGTAVSTTGSFACPLTYVNGAWYPASGATSAASGGFSTAGTGLTAAGSTVSLTTPVAVANGGTGSAAPAGTAGTGLSVSGSFPNQQYALSTPVSVANGGTGGTTQSTATANSIGAAGKGANTDITSLAGLTTPLSVAQGGIGQSTLTANAPLFGNSTSGILSGTTSGNTLQVATFSGAATAARCLHTDSSGNVTVTSTDCTAVSAPGFVNTPTVTPSGGNSTTTWGVQCGGVGCVDFEKVANASNTGTLTMSPPVATTMITGELFWVYVIDSGTAPSDILLGTAPANVAYQSYVVGLLASDLTTAGATAAKKRANACGAPQANSVSIYQFWWDGANLNLTGCGETPSNTAIAIALGGTGSTVGSLNNALQIANDSTTGTTADKLVALTTANPAAAIIASAGQMSGIVGICDSSLGTCSNSGTATVINYGDHNCIFDATGATAGHYIGPSTVTAGACADVGAMPAGGLLVIGRVYSNCAGGADCKINFLSTTDILNNGGVASAVTFNTLPNATSIGTTMGKLALITASTMQTIGTTATSGVQGICTANCGTGAPNPTIQVAGATSCAVAATATPGHYAVADASNAGDCADGGATFPVGGNEVVGTFLSTVSGGTAKVMLWGPDVANSAGGGGGGIASPVMAGNPTFYGSAANAVNPVAGVIYIHAYTGASPDPLHAAQASCPNNGPCILMGTPGDIYTVGSPFWLGMGLANGNFIGPNALNQTLDVNGAIITFNDTTVENSFPVDDGLIIGGRARVYCRHNESSTAQSHIGTAGTVDLNSVVTNPAGVISNAWEASHTYKVGQVIKDSNSNIEYVTVGGVSGSGSHPTWPTTLGNPVTEGASNPLLTWEEIVPGNLTSAGQEWEIEGCKIAGNVNTTAHINNVVGIRGVAGGKVRMYDDDVSALSSETDGGSNGDLAAYNGGTKGGSVGIRIDSGQSNGFCTGPNTPLACCSAANAGTCAATIATTCCGEINGTFLAPGQVPVSVNGPSAELYMNGAAFIRALDSQWADMTGTNNIALAYIKGSTSITLENNYFESNIISGSQQAVGSDQLQLYDDKGFMEVNDFHGNNGSTGLKIANCIHITGQAAANTSYVHVQGEGLAVPCTTYIKNDWNTEDNNTTTGAYDYIFTSPTNATEQPHRLNAFALSYYMANSHCTGPGAPISCCTGSGAGGCAAVPNSPVLASNYATFICTGDADACTAGTTYSNSGTHATMCLLEENEAGTAWIETGTKCY